MAWDEVRERLATAKTQQEREAAAAALAKHIPQEHLDKHIVVMQKGGVHAVRLGQLPQTMNEDPQVYDMVNKIVRGKRR
jgi:hypothetical protein